jgi:hypothetical protein
MTEAVTPLYEDEAVTRHLSEETVTALYESLQSMTVALDANPLDYTPVRLASKVAKTREYLSEVQDSEQLYLHLQISVSRELIQLRNDVELETDMLMAVDEAVQKAATQKIREAMIRYKLKDQITSIKNLEELSTVLDLVMKMLKSKKQDLKDVQSRVKEQASLCADQIKLLNGGWGGKEDFPTPNLTPEKTDGFDTSFLDDFE